MLNFLESCDNNRCIARGERRSFGNTKESRVARRLDLIQQNEFHEEAEGYASEMADKPQIGEV